jgi:hypothetical protein
VTEKARVTLIWNGEKVIDEGQPPRLRRDADKQKEKPLGTLAEVREKITRQLPGIEWRLEPPLLDLMRSVGFPTQGVGRGDARQGVQAHVDGAL